MTAGRKVPVVVGAEVAVTSVRVLLVGRRGAVKPVSLTAVE